MRAAIALAALTLLAAPAGAATFTITALPDGRPAVRMDGKIEPADASTFDGLARDPLRPAALILSSPGGDLAASLTIGSEVRRDGIQTIVPPYASCASGCGLVWLAGVKRYVASTARVGFHAPSANDEASRLNLPAASAAIGAYMGRLGLSDAAVAYMNTASPDDMAWLGWDEADTLGVQIDPFVEIVGHPSKLPTR